MLENYKDREINDGPAKWIEIMKEVKKQEEEE